MNLKNNYSNWNLNISFFSLVNRDGFLKTLFFQEDNHL